MKHFIVVGASAAGGAAVEAIRLRDPDCRLTLISDEPLPLYSRCLLSEYLAGYVGRDALAFRQPGWATELNIETVEDRVVEVVARAGEVRTVGGRRLGYDGLVLATGATAVMPPIPGIDADGVAVPYRLDQTDVALASLRGSAEVVVLGAGKVGLKAAEAAVAHGRRVTLVEQAAQPLPGMLDATGGDVVRALLEAHGVTVLTGASVVEVHPRNGRSAQAVLSSGERVACQTLLVAVGVRPRVDLARQAGAKVAEGVVVDERMRTSLEGVYAAGDVAQAPVLHEPGKAVLANWLNAVQQGRAAGSDLTGGTEAYPGGVRANAFRLWQMPVISVGEVDGPGEAFVIKGNGIYRKLTFRGRRLVGVMRVGGEVRDVGVLTALVKSGKTVDDPGALVANGFAHFASQRLRVALAGALSG